MINTPDVFVIDKALKPSQTEAQHNPRPCREYPDGLSCRKHFMLICHPQVLFPKPQDELSLCL